MKIARFWVRETLTFPWRDGEEGETGCWGWSETSKAEASERSRAATRRVIDWLINDAPDRLGEYDYLNRPAREEIVQEIQGPDKNIVATLTRNAYGALVLNAEQLFFADVDLPKDGGGFFGGIRSLFGGGKRSGSDPESELRETIRAWSREHPAIGLAVYRTAAGFRCLITNHAVSATSEQSRLWLDGLSNDPLYRRLCETQECFRARLTPKPWRIGFKAPDVRFPFADEAAKRDLATWVEAYDRAASAFATCRRVERLGPSDVLSELAPLIELHDRLTRCDAEAPLA